MLAEQSLRDGDVVASLHQLKEQVKVDPANAKLRVFLFQLLSIQGEWNRALTQLNVSGELDASTLAMVQTYREALQCEAYRAEVFSGKKPPHFFGKPEEWMALCVEALGHATQGRSQQAADLLARAYESAPATTGTINGEGFEWIADADSRLGPFLEAVISSTYYWVPFNRIHRIDIEEPEDLRDMVWAPAHFTWANGGEVVGLIPTRYPGTEFSEDPLIQLARKTEWLDQGDEQFFGLGQRILATDMNDYPILEVRDIVLQTDEASDEQTIADGQ